LIGVISRGIDFARATHEHWYRIPVRRRPLLFDAGILGFYTSAGVAARLGGIYFFAETRGHELCRRRDLIPDEPNHIRADDLYYRIALSVLERKTPPILTNHSRRISFITTTWERFSSAVQITDLYGAR